MPKRKRRMKHYRRSVYSRQDKTRGVIGAVVLVAVVLGAAWLAAPRVLDWATHTWYTVVRGRDLSAEGTLTQETMPNAPEEGEAEPEPTPVPTPTPLPQITLEKWASVQPGELQTEEAVRELAQKLRQDGVRYVSVTLKETDGLLAYNSEVPLAARSTARTLIDPGMVAAVLKEYELKPVARLAVFRDPAAAYADHSTAIRYMGTSSVWLDAAGVAAGGKPWLNPYSSSALEYISSLVVELRGLGFQHVLLANVQFPTSTSDKQYYGEKNGRDRAAQLTADIARWEEEFRDMVTVWYEYGYEVCVRRNVTLGARPAELGVKNLVIRMPGSDRPGKAQVNQVVQSMKELGAEYVAVWDGTTASFPEE